MKVTTTSVYEGKQACAAAVNLEENGEQSCSARGQSDHTRPPQRAVDRAAAASSHTYFYISNAPRFDAERGRRPHQEHPLHPAHWEGFLDRYVSLTLLDHEVAGRASLVNDELVLHYLLDGCTGYMPPETLDSVREAYADCYFHVHPHRAGTVGCWPSIEDLTAIVEEFYRFPLLRSSAVLTACGLFVAERHPTEWDTKFRIDGCMDAQYEMYSGCAAVRERWRGADARNATEHYTPAALRAIAERHGLVYSWFPRLPQYTANDPVVWRAMPYNEEYFRDFKSAYEEYSEEKNKPR